MTVLIRVVGVDGMSGAGKSKAAVALAANLQSLLLPIGLDDFFAFPRSDWSREDVRNVTEEAFLSVVRDACQAVNQFCGASTRECLDWAAFIASHYPSLTPYLPSQPQPQPVQPQDHRGVVYRYIVCEGYVLFSTRKLSDVFHYRMQVSVPMELASLRRFLRGARHQGVEPGSSQPTPFTSRMIQQRVARLPPRIERNRLEAINFWAEQEREQLVWSDNGSDSSVRQEDEVCEVCVTQRGRERAVLLSYFCSELPVALPPFDAMAEKLWEREEDDHARHRISPTADEKVARIVFPPLREEDGEVHSSLPLHCREASPETLASIWRVLLQHSEEAASGSGPDDDGAPTHRAAGNKERMRALWECYSLFRSWFFFEVGYYHCVQTAADVKGHRRHCQRDGTWDPGAWFEVENQWRAPLVEMVREVSQAILDKDRRAY